MPATRNRSSVGMPKRPPAFVMSILQNISIEPTKSRFSEVKNIIICILRSEDTKIQRNIVHKIQLIACAA
jgi:hypothetical protein